MLEAAAAAICLLGTMLVSTIEASFAGISEARVRAAMVSKVPGAQRLQAWLNESGRILTTLSLLRLSGVLGAGLAAWRLADGSVSGLSLLWFVPAAAMVVLLFGYLLPRSFAKPRSLPLAIATIRFVRALTYLLLPVTWPLRLVLRLLAPLLRMSSTWNAAFWTPDEIERLAVEAETTALGQRGKELLHSIIEFSDTVIREIMVPRTEMVAIEASSPSEEVLRTIIEAGHSRVPVYEETIDNIAGVLHVKDLFNSLCSWPAEGQAPKFDLRSRVRPTFYVPEVMKISELLKEFQRRKTHMAIVVDEYGGTAGVVTLEDIIEEIVGDIQDEYDVDEKQFRVLADNKVIADGRVNIWDLEQALGVKFPEQNDYETLAGFLMSRAGHLPRPGTVIQWGGLRFTIKEANDKRIGTVEIERKKPEATAVS
jgi:putative hemolysin